MLNKKDKEQIREIFREEFARALTRTLELERGPRKQGDPEEKRVVEERWNLIDFIAGYVPYLEGAIRGMQETTDLLKNNVDSNNKALEAVGNTLLGMEDSAKHIARLSDLLKALEHPGASRLIEMERNEGYR
jgi:hypothetical protein